MPIVWPSKRVGKCILEKGDSVIHVQRITIKKSGKMTRRKIMVKGMIMDRRAICGKRGRFFLGRGKGEREGGEIECVCVCVCVCVYVCV
jgi:hypothetical protein